MSTCILWLQCGYKEPILWPVDEPSKADRPKRAGGKNQVVRMRISAEHKKALEDAAARDGLELSVWLRQLALRAAGVLGTPQT